MTTHQLQILNKSRGFVFDLKLSYAELINSFLLKFYDYLMANYNLTTI